MPVSTQTYALIETEAVQISGGIIAPTKGYIVVSAETSTTDDLDTINASMTDVSSAYFPFIMVKAASGHTITLKHGTGNLSLFNTADVTLSGDKHLWLFDNGTNWVDLGGGAGAGGSSLPVADTTEIVKGSVDDTKRIRFEVDGLTTAITRVITPPDADFTMVGETTSQTLTNKTINADNSTITNIGASEVKSDIITGHPALSALASNDGLLVADASASFALRRTALLDVFNTPIAQTELTISSGAVTKTQVYHSIDTESDAATDDLDTISGGSEGQRLYIRANNAARTVVVKHGTGNIQTYDGVDISLDETRKLLLLLHDGTNWNVVGFVGTSGSGLYASIATLEEQQTSGTAGGTFTSGADQTRLLNTEVSDPDGIVTISGNQFTLGAGAYEIEGWASAFLVDEHQAIIRNVTDSTDVKRGMSCEATSASSAGVDRAYVKAIVTIAGSKAFELRHRCVTTRATDGFGRPTSLGTETYSHVTIRKFA